MIRCREKTFQYAEENDVELGRITINIMHHTCMIICSSNQLICFLSFMPYYGFFSCDLHILDLWWRSHYAYYFYAP